MIETPIDQPTSTATGSAARSVALLVVCVGLFMVSIDTTAVNVALPALSRSLGTRLSGLQWVVDSYTLVFAAGLLSSGAAGDRIGPKRVFQAGLLSFTVASALCAAAPSAGTLTAARAVQGVGAALLVATSLPLLQGMYPSGPARAKAFGIWGSVGGAAVALGPVVGGTLVDSTGWRAVFVINLPFGLLGLLAAARCIPRLPGRPRRIDATAQVLSLLALGSLTYASIEAGSAGWGAARVLAGFAVALVAAVAFVAIERRTTEPMLDIAFFRDVPFSVAAFAGMANNFGFYGQLFVMGLYFQEVAHDSAERTGFLLLPQAASSAVAAYFTGRVTARTGARLPMLAGLAAGAAGLAGLAVDGPHTSYALMVLPLVAVGFAVGFTAPAAMTVVMGRVAPERAGIASGVINAARQSGSVLGVAVLGSVFGVLSGHRGGGLSALWIAAGGYAAAFALVLAFVRAPRKE